MPRPSHPDECGGRDGGSPPSRDRISAAPDDPRPRRILGVGGEAHVRRLIEVNLRDAGCELLTAADAQDALAKARSEQPDLVVLDVLDAGEDRWELLRRRKADREIASIPVVMLTAKAQDAEVFRGWQSGVDCFLSKPFDPRELLRFFRRPPR